MRELKQINQEVYLILIERIDVYVGPCEDICNFNEFKPKYVSGKINIKVNFWSNGMKMLKIKEDKLGIHATVCAKRKGKPAVIRASEGTSLHKLAFYLNAEIEMHKHC